VLAALEERFGAVPAAVEQAVLAVTDPGLLSQLLRQAVKVPTLEALEALLRERDRSPDR
jgi:NhaP-type Na+/H+ or K+/H+ antiporter